MVMDILFPLSGSGDMDSLPKVREDIYSLQPCSLYPVFLVWPWICGFIAFGQNSPGNLSMSNQPGTPREDGEMGGNFLNPFQNESVSVGCWLHTVSWALHK